MITVREAPNNRSVGLACTAASMKRMPPEAIEDLRRRCVALELYHNIQRAPMAVRIQQCHVNHAQDEWVLPPDDPVHAIVGHHLASHETADPAYLGTTSPLVNGHEPEVLIWGEKHCPPPEQQP
eukprot:6001586-Heterocapsa_arctica.AAC.1